MAERNRGRSGGRAQATGAVLAAILAGGAAVAGMERVMPVPTGLEDTAGTARVTLGSEEPMVVTDYLLVFFKQGETWYVKRDVHVAWEGGAQAFAGRLLQGEGERGWRPDDRLVGSRGESLRGGQVWPNAETARQEMEQGWLDLGRVAKGNSPLPAAPSRPCLSPPSRRPRPRPRSAAGVPSTVRPLGPDRNEAGPSRGA